MGSGNDDSDKNDGQNHTTRNVLIGVGVAAGAATIIGLIIVLMAGRKKSGETAHTGSAGEVYDPAYWRRRRQENAAMQDFVDTLAEED
jgi:hypothetical protein